MLKTSLLCFLIFSLSAASWYDQKLEGWYYFEDFESRKITKDSPSSLDDAEEILEAEKRNLKKLLSLALLEPSVQNVENYIIEQRKWISQSSSFADKWGKILLEKPYLGDFLQNPTTSYGLIAKREADLSQRKKSLQKASESYFLLFFFRGQDPLSVKAAEVANLFASMNQWRIKAVSLDGIKISGIECEIDKGLSLKLNIEVAPSFFVIDPFENKAFPVGAGLISVSDLEQNIENQLTDVDAL